MANLLDHLGWPLEEKGITFVNGKLAALPGFDTDHDLVLQIGGKSSRNQRPRRSLGTRVHDAKDATKKRPMPVSRPK